MKDSRDLGLIIVFAVMNFIFMLIIGQVARAIPIYGIGYVFIIFYSIIASVAWLMYEGRRWRIFAQGLLFNSLTLLFIPSRGSPIVLGALANVFIVDLIFNSVYGFFKKKNILIWWIIILQVFFWVAAPLFDVVFLSLLVYPFEMVLKNYFIPLISLMLPVMIIEAIAGAYIGYRLYRRVENLT